MLLFMNLTNVF